MSTELVVINPTAEIPNLSDALVSPSLTPEYLKLEEIEPGHEIRCIFWSVEPRKVIDPRTGEEKMLESACFIESSNNLPRAWYSAATALVGKLKDLEKSGNLAQGNPILLRYTRYKKGKKGMYADWSVHHLYIRESAA